MRTYRIENKETGTKIWSGKAKNKEDAFGRLAKKLGHTSLIEWIQNGGAKLDLMGCNDIEISITKDKINMLENKLAAVVDRLESELAKQKAKLKKLENERIDS